MDQVSFGERFARNWAVGMAGLGVFTAVTVVGGHGRLFPLLGVMLVLTLSQQFRRRAIYDAAHPRRALEDERDRAFLAHGDRGFRVAASLWMAGMALALVIAPVRELLLVQPMRLPGLLVLGVIVAGITGHVVVAWAYLRDRS